MWLINYVTKNSITNPQAETGNIKSAEDGTVQINASSDYKYLPVVAPFGVTYVPTSGSQTVVLPVYGGEMCMGVVAPESDLEPGELMLYSAGGASITLKNDGNVYINGEKYGE